eukprot:6185158-Pleurochrysis_carterae.AAC.1
MLCGRARVTCGSSSCACVRECACLRECACVRERACVRECACVRERACVREFACGRERACVRERACPTACVRARRTSHIAQNPPTTIDAIKLESTTSRVKHAIANGVIKQKTSSSHACVCANRRRQAGMGVKEETVLAVVLAVLVLTMLALMVLIKVTGLRK